MAKPAWISNCRELIVELKAVEIIHPIHHAQVMNYLKATRLQLALLMNFNLEALRDGIKRFVLTS
jgi:GxxExxY protein